MAFTKFDDLWTLMSRYTFETVNDSREEDLSCMICEKIMVDSCQSSCGCQYCQKCIQGYLGGESKYCPGDKEECKEEHLLLDGNVCRNGVLNRKISKLRVHCPNESCPFTEELTKMGDHILFCTSQEEDCPFSILGCDSKAGSKDKISTHVYEDSLKHNHLLIEYIHNLKNELSNEFRNETRNYETLNREINRLNEDLENTKMELNVWKLDSIRKENEIEELKKAVSELKNDFQKIQMEMKVERERQNTKIKLLKERYEGRKKSDKGRKRKINTALWVAESCLNQRGRKIRNDDGIKLRKEWNEEKEKINILNESSPNINLNILSKSLNVDFVWRVEEISKKREQNIFSDSFVSNNYRLCLYLRFQSVSILLGGAIMKGEKDDEVEWPMRRALKVSLLDQDSLRSVETLSLPYDTDSWCGERPTNERNHPRFCYISLNFSSLNGQPSVLVRDSLLVSGVLSDP